MEGMKALTSQRGSSDSFVNAIKLIVNENRCGIWYEYYSDMSGTSFLVRALRKFPGPPSVT